MPPNSTHAATASRHTGTAQVEPARVEPATSADVLSIVAISQALPLGERLSLAEVTNYAKGAGNSILVTRNGSRAVTGFVTLQRLPRKVLIDNVTLRAQPASDADVQALLFAAIQNANATASDAVLFAKTPNGSEAVHKWVSELHGFNCCGSTYGIQAAKLVSWLDLEPATGRSYTAFAEGFTNAGADAVRAKYEGAAGVRVRGTGLGSELERGGYIIEVGKILKSRAKAGARPQVTGDAFCIVECGDGVLRLTDLFLPDTQDRHNALRAMLKPLEKVLRDDGFLQVEIAAGGTPGILGQQLSGLGFAITARTYVARSASFSALAASGSSLVFARPELGLPIPRRAEPKDHVAIAKLRSPGRQANAEVPPPALGAGKGAVLQGEDASPGVVPGAEVLPLSPASVAVSVAESRGEPAVEVAPPYLIPGEVFVLEDQGVLAATFRVVCDGPEKPIHVDVVLDGKCRPEAKAGVVESILLQPTTHGVPSAQIIVNANIGTGDIRKVLTDRGFTFVGASYVITKESIKSASGSSRPWTKVGKDFTTVAAADAARNVTADGPALTAEGYEELLHNDKMELLYFAVTPSTGAFLLVEQTESGPAFRRIIPHCPLGELN